jgi:hypothetical protein
LRKQAGARYLFGEFTATKKNDKGSDQPLIQYCTAGYSFSFLRQAGLEAALERGAARTRREAA